VPVAPAGLVGVHLRVVASLADHVGWGVPWCTRAGVLVLLRGVVSRVETPDYSGFLKRSIRSYGKRVADADPEDLAEMDVVLGELLDAMQVAVNGQLEAGASWADIGRAFGITRQSAWERFGRNARAVGSASV